MARRREKEAEPVRLDNEPGGRWMAEAIVSRYREFARQFRIPEAAVISEIEAGTPTHVVLYRVTAAAEAGDAACVELLVEFIHEDRGMMWGRLFKSNAARALRRAALNYGQEDRIRRRVVKMLLAGNVPYEFRE